MLTDMMKDELVKGLLNLFHENLSMIILYGSVARNEATSESDIDIAIITKNDMNEEIRNKFICWSAEMDIRYDKIFSIIDIKEENKMDSAVLAKVKFYYNFANYGFLVLCIYIAGVVIREFNEQKIKRRRCKSNTK